MNTLNISLLLNIAISINRHCALFAFGNHLFKQANNNSYLLVIAICGLFFLLTNNDIFKCTDHHSSNHSQRTIFQNTLARLYRCRVSLEVSIINIFVFFCKRKASNLGCKGVDIWGHHSQSSPSKYS